MSTDALKTAASEFVFFNAEDRYLLVLAKNGLGWDPETETPTEGYTIRPINDKGETVERKDAVQLEITLPENGTKDTIYVYEPDGDGFIKRNGTQTFQQKNLLKHAELIKTMALYLRGKAVANDVADELDKALDSIATKGEKLFEDASKALGGFFQKLGSKLKGED